MATKRYRQGLYRYSPKRVQAARARPRTGPRPDSKAGRRQARKSAARGRLPKPGTAAAKRRAESFLPDTAEVRWLREQARVERVAKGLGRQADTPYLDEYQALADQHYRAAYNAQQRERKASKPKAPTKPKAKRKGATWTWVRRHRRRIGR